MSKQTFINYDLEQDTTYIRSTVPRDIVNFYNMYREYITYEDTVEKDDKDDKVVITQLCLEIPGSILY